MPGIKKTACIYRSFFSSIVALFFLFLLSPSVFAADLTVSTALTATQNFSTLGDDLTVTAAGSIIPSTPATPGAATNPATGTANNGDAVDFSGAATNGTITSAGTITGGAGGAGGDDSDTGGVTSNATTGGAGAAGALGIDFNVGNTITITAGTVTGGAGGAGGTGEGPTNAAGGTGGAGASGGTGRNFLSRG